MSTKNTAMNTDRQSNTQITDFFNLATLDPAVKWLFSSYLLTIGLGAILALGQILLTHGMADGKFGLSIDDIVYSYNGDPKSSKIILKLNGSMRDKASSAEKLQIIKWIRKGATEKQWNNEIKTIFYKNCISCHGVIPGLPDFTQYETVREVAKTNMGASTTSLTRVSHIHIFGISFIFFFNGLIFCFAIGINKTLKILIISLPFFFLATDISSWWLTKINPQFAWITIITGIGYNICSAIVWFVSLYQMWILPMRNKVND